MKDFELAQGKMETGLKGAIVSALLYAVIPFFVLTFAISMMAGSLNPDDRMLREALEQLRGTLLLLSIPIIVMRFFGSYYFKGTRSRLLFALLSALAILAYAYALFLGAGLNDALQLFNVVLDLDLVFLLAFIGVTMLFLRHFGTYVTYRAGWLKSVGVESPAIRPEPRAGMAEFTLAHGNFCQGNAFAKSAGIWFALVPSLSLTIFVFLVSISPQASIPALTSFLAVLGSIAWMAALLSLPLIGLAWFRGFYPKGTVPRLVFGIAFALMIAVYLYLLLVASDLQTSLDGLGLTLEVQSIFLVLLLLVIFLLLKYVGEMADERRTWKRNNGMKVEVHRSDPENRWADLDPHYGKFERGFKESQRALMFFIVLPVIALMILIAILATVQDPTVASFVPVLQDLSRVVLLYGIPVVALGFAKGFYLKGSGGRLLFALLMMVAIAVYLFALLLGGKIESAMVSAGLPLDLDAIWALLLVLVLFHGIMDVAEMLDNRRRWKIAIGRKVRPVVEEEHHDLLLDFRPRYGRYLTGCKEAKSALKKYVIVPGIIIIIMIAAVQALIDQFSLPQLSVILDDLRSISSVLLAFALPLLALTFLRGFYPKGSVSRLTFAWIVCGVLAGWLWSITLGGQFATDLELQGGMVGVQLDLSGIILIFVVLELLWGLYYTAEYISYRKDWIANRYQPVDEGVKRPRSLKPAIRA